MTATIVKPLVCVTQATLKDLIVSYYAHRDLPYPTIEEALMWAQTELAEVYELLLARNPNWIRNHPEKHPPFTKEALAEELGDAIMMLFVAGIVAGVDPIQSLSAKILVAHN